MPDTVWINGEYHARDSATISVFDHGLLYGDGVFEGIRAYDGRIFRLEAHLRRLQDSAKAIALPIPMTLDELATACTETFRRSELRDAYFRVVVTRGIGDLGLNPMLCPSPTVIIIVATIRLFPPEKLREGVRLVTAATPVPHREALSPRVKSLNYLPHVMAKLEGLTAGADDVLMLDPSGSVAEGSGQNLFVVTEGVVRTPPPSAGILRGVTRDVVLEIAAGLGIPVREELLNRYDVYTAEEAFLTGTASEVVPVRSLDGRLIGEALPGPVTARLLEGFQALVRAGN
ncbi:MAG TPA: branched-chain-amino-acid transaminase [Gemmatimonadales bacterium]|nr:branched-chain-amino-acid transaminase [Gemmatimonadales bacterium]